MTDNPLIGINTSFRDYITMKKRAAELHMDGNGLPDYAFALDFELRKKLDSIPNFYNISRKIAATYSSRQLQIINQKALAVTPNQFPEVYAIGRACAKILGIGIPAIYILSDQTLNAYTYATDDVEPMIVIHSALYERFTPGELKFVIGHECGHIHNTHGIYGVMAQILILGGAGALTDSGISLGMFNLILKGAVYALNAWMRAGEITCDRAGMICCERLEDSYTAEAKFMYGAAFGEHEINLDEIMKQLNMQESNITRFEELFNNHPVVARRIAAEKYFADCETLYKWRPDLMEAGRTLRSREQTDELCKRCVSIIKN
ncbi:MAG: M48 family metallopeptidase [Synergistaceae bacterium]|nr:M48 family metallopeptidase [Synergistaceae bacterium]